jgi:post-segregation antitoxin (ccd killing protein)
MTILEISLPDSLAKEAKAAGLLAPEAIEQLIAQALRRKTFERLLAVAERVEAAGVQPMTPEEINTEIKAYRAERRNAAP